MTRTPRNQAEDEQRDEPRVYWHPELGYIIPAEWAERHGKAFLDQVQHHSNPNDASGYTPGGLVA